MMMAAARRWVPTRTALVAVSSGAAIAGMSDRPAATVVTTTNRRRSRRSRANTTPRAAPTRVHHANAGIGMALALISRLTSAALRDGCHDGGADGSDCACERTASNKTASARLVGLHDRFLVGGVLGGGHRRFPSLRRLVEMRGEVVEDCAPAGHHFGEELVLPIRSASVSTRDDADHATAAGR